MINKDGGVGGMKIVWGSVRISKEILTTQFSSSHIQHDLTSN
jgi:hypothetical protein